MHNVHVPDVVVTFLLPVFVSPFSTISSLSILDTLLSNVLSNPVTVPLPILRQSMCILPQEATMFSGTVRSNLDPFGKTTDERMKERDYFK